MFTGIIQEVGIFKNKFTAGDKYQVTIETDNLTQKITRGESIAVNGACLTVVEFDQNYFTADVMPETLKSTNLKELKKGSKVNLELPLTPADFMGGHIVTGHIDGIGKIRNIKSQKNAYLIDVSFGKELRKFMVDKGSIALNGVSLTIADINNEIIRVSLIPETWNQTNFCYINSGDIVNIETDLIGKYVIQIMNRNKEESNQNSKLNKDFLSQNGFM
ncbi:MAG: riboflavin synthase [Bacillota bacterium]